MNVGMRPGTGSFVLLILLAVLATASFAQDDNNVAGKWRTTIDGGMGETIVLLIELRQDAAGTWTGNTRSNQNPDVVDELRDIRVAGDGVEFHTLNELKDRDLVIRSDFTMTYYPSEEKLRGDVEVSTSGMERTYPVEFTRVVEKGGASELSYQGDRPLLGAWSARPDKDDKERLVELEILPDADAYQGTFTDTGIDQTVAVRDLSVKDTSVSFNFRFTGAPFMSSFWGRYDPERDEVRGSMSIGGRSQPMTFERTSPGPDDVADEFGTEKKPLPKRHHHKFAVTARASYWAPLYVIKDNVRNINDITSGNWAWDVGLRYYLVDYLAVQVRYVHGGLGFDTNEQNLALFDPVDGPQGAGLSQPLTTESYLSMDGFEFSMIGYLGQNLFPTSRFNPYIIGVAGRTDWTLTSAGRGTEPIAIFELPLEGTDWTFGGGLGTEYDLGKRWGLELEWLWAYTLTSDEVKWQDTTYQWTNQHVYRFSLGLIFRF